MCIYIDIYIYIYISPAPPVLERGLCLELPAPQLPYYAGRKTYC